MSYSKKRSVVRGRRRGMGEDFWLTTKMDQAAADQDRAEQLACIDQANANAQVQAIQAKQNELLTWNPLPTVSVTDLSILTTALKSAIAEAKATVAASPRSTGDAAAQINNAISDLVAFADNRTNAWDAAIAQARATGAGIINAPDLKTSTLKILNHISNAFMVAAFMQCRINWLDRAKQIIGRIVDIAKQIIGAVIDGIKKVVNAAAAPLNILAWLGKYPYVPIGIAAIILFKRFGVKV